ncbi:BZ3500_MvSof-1268-A1-R1_Chr4-2g06959 [Microbotryum saponariae]|uniref:Kinetochore protein Spc24 n=1 Tax=Microbotryum saponariae TaxID=289078 RepID=A0A2X0MXN3_9BASI|nr:BZ3500_MvSof-1268-A1-R1_Chr4-2g06959 [Microbotryum saponariae]SDA06624.1 BZ3501_MvSof-1269-A2-R1_Chr4-2g06670 [Microbotryum saponariae]
MSAEMAKFDEEYGTLIEGTLELFKNADGDEPIDWDEKKRLWNGPEVKIMHRTIEGVEELNKRSKVVVDHARDHLRALAREQERLRIAASRPAGVPSAEEHVRLMEQNRQQLFTGYKKNSELEQNVARLQAELARLQQELRDEDADVVHVSELNSEVLRLSLYRNLGFMPKEQDGAVRAVIVKSQASDKVRTVQLDAESSDFAWSNTLWNGLVA